LSLAGKFIDVLPDSQGAHLGAHVHVGTVSGHAPSDAIIIPDAHLLFGGDFKRSGVDLILSGDDREVVLHDYFKGEKRAALASPDGAHLTGDIINALTGHTQFAQADGSASVAQVIGHVTKLAGTATAIRNGVSIILNQGDNVNKGDVVASGSDSTLGITFIDGTVFGLASNAKMVLNEMIYDPNGSDNKSLISLVQGTISFVAGATAKHGDMKVDTPVATMGIRGTAVLVEIDFTVPASGGAPPAKFQVLVEPDGTTGSYILFDKTTLTPIATVNQAGTQTVVNGQGGVNFLSSAQLSADAQKIITDVFALKFSDLNSPNTKLTTNFTDSIVPENFFVKLANGESVAVTTFSLNVADKPASVTPGATVAGRDHVAGAPAIATTGGAAAEHVLTTGSAALDSATGSISYADINPNDVPTVQTEFASFSYQNSGHADVSATLTAAQLAAIHAVEVPLVVVQDAAGINHGVATWTYSIADGAFDFLAAGEVLTLTYRARVDNNYAPSNETAFQTFTITVTGTNDVPVITTSVPQIDFAGGKTTPGGVLTAHVPTSGTLTFKDPDLTDHHTVAAALSTVALDGVDVGTVAPAPLSFFQTALTASIAADSTNSGTGTINWSLADFPVYLADFIPLGKTLTLTYTVTVTDSQGAISTQQVVVTITGLDTPAVVWIATAHPGQPAGGLWSDGANWETGTVPTANDDAIIITNQLIGLTPSFPVTINQAAVAKTVTMNDFGTTAPVLINNSTLAVGDSFSMSSDSVLQNFGTVTVGGLMEIRDHSSLQNSGTLKLAGGGDFKNQSSITNAATGKIEISGGTLTVQADIANSGEVKVDSAAVLALDGGAITGGTVTNGGAIEVAGDSSINGAALNNGQLTVDGGQKLTLNGTTVTGTTITDTGTISVDSGKTLKLSGVTLSGGAITNAGTIEIIGSSSISNDQLTNHQLTVDGGQTLTLNGTTVTGGIVTNAGAINVDTGQMLKLNGVALSGGAITNSGTVEITGNSSINSDHLTNHQLTVDGGKMLTLSGTTVTGGSITDAGTIKVAGSSNINGASLNIALSGLLLVDSGVVLGLDSTTVSGGPIQILGELDSTGSSFIIGSSVTNGAGTIKVASGSTLELDNGTIVNGGSLVNSGTLQIETSSGATLNGVAVTGGGIINVDVPADAATLILEGGTSITDGTLVNGNVGTVEIYGIDGATFDNVDVSNAGLLQVDGTSKLLLVGGATIIGGHVTVASGGLLETYGAGIEINAVVNNNGTIEITENGTLKISSSISGTGSVRIDGGATFELNGSDSQTVEFNGADAVFRIDGSSFGGSIVGFATSDQIDLKAFGYDETTTATFEKGVLTLFHGGQSISMALVGDYSHAHLAGSGDGTHTLITLKAEDDAPVFAEDSEKGSIDEQPNTIGSSAPDSVGGTLHFGDVDLLDRPTASVTSKSVTWTAADTHTDLGTPSQLAAIENALTLTQSGNANNGAIGWNYSIADGVLDFLAEGETITFKATVTLTDGEKSDTATVIVTITGHNDAPVINTTTTVASGIVSEGDPSHGADMTATGTITYTDVDATDTHVFSLSGAAASHGTASVDPVTGLWTYTATDSGAVDALAAGEHLADSFTVKVADNHGGSTTQLVTIDIVGTNDAPVINTTTVASGIVSEGDPSHGADMTATGTITYTDVDATDTHVFSLSGAAASYGTASVDPVTGLWTYTATDSGVVDALAAGEHLADSFTVKVADNHGGSTTQLVSIDIVGTNDPAVVGGTDTQNLTETNAVLTTGGTLTISDVDSAATFAAQTNVAGSHGYGHFSINAAGVWSYATDTAHNEFAIGATYTDTLSVSSADGTLHQLTVNILGTNDPAVISGQTIGAVEVADDGPGSGTLTATGTLTDTDVDNAANTFVAAAAGSGTDHGYGTYQMTAGGLWTYTLNNSNPAVRALDENQHLTDTFTVHAVDGTAQIITINVTDNDDPDHDVYAVDGTTLLSASTAFMSGGSHNFIGTSTNDTIIGNNGSTADNISAQGGNDTIYGRGGNDVIQGGDGNDIIYAGSGNDTIIGGAGADQLWGGSGKDIFVFAAAADSTPASFDTIQDFQVGTDHIDVSGLGFSAATSGFGALAAHGVNWSQVGSDTVILGDTNGISGNAEFQIILKGVTATSLHLSDFNLS
jgi:VCBS repeat-containing protein